MSYFKSFSFILTFLLLLTILPSHGQTLQLGMAATSAVLGPDGYSTVSVVVSNNGAQEAKNVVVTINLPSDIDDFRDAELPNFDCPGSYCEASEVATWTVGDLAVGQSQSIFFKIQVLSTVTATVINSSAVASSSNASSALASLAVGIDQTPLLKVGLTASGSVRPGKETVYTLSLGNMGSLSPSNATLTMPVPTGTSFVSASHGGTLNSGMVSWNIGQLGSGEGRLIDLIVMGGTSLNDGDLIEAHAELDPNLPAEEAARSSVVDAVVSSPALNLHYGIASMATGQGGEITYTLTATNSGSTNLTNAEGLIMLPAFIHDFREAEIPGFDCPGTDCGANEIVTWSIGTLAPGQSATVSFRSFTLITAPFGQITTSTARLSATNATHAMVAQNVQIDPTPLLKLSLSSDPAPVAPGMPLVYTLTFGNLGAAAPSNAALHMPVPDGTAFISASHGGTLSGNVVSWPIPTLAAGVGHQFRLTVTPNAGLAQGKVITAYADLVSNVPSEYTIRSTSALPVNGNTALHLKYEVTPRVTEPGNAVTYTVTATNKGVANLLNVSAQVLLPDLIVPFPDGPLTDFDCPSSNCEPNEIAAWDIGTLTPNQSKVISFSSTVIQNAYPGSVLDSRVSASASNTATSTAMACGDVLVGSLLNIDIEENALFTNDLSLSNYPNPFTGTTTFSIHLPVPAKVSLKVYSGTGQEVATVMQENLAVGNFRLDWDANGLAPGLYFYRLESATFSKTGKLILN